MHSWDIVNEAIDLKSGRSDALRETPWLKAFGPSYIDDAFRAARTADPHALLVYNDWGCEAGENDRFRAVTLDFLERALSRGVPVDALGLQGHLAAFGPQVDQKKLRNFLAQVKAMGLKILVTEHDVEDEGGPYDTALRDRAVADASRRFLEVVLDCDATVAVLTWGLSDRFLEPEGWREKLFEAHPRALPLDADLARKPLWMRWQALWAAMLRQPPLNHSSAPHGLFLSDWARESLPWVTEDCDVSSAYREPASPHGRRASDRLRAAALQQDAVDLVRVVRKHWDLFRAVVLIVVGVAVLAALILPSI